MLVGRAEDNPRPAFAKDAGNQILFRHQILHGGSASSIGISGVHFKTLSHRRALGHSEPPASLKPAVIQSLPSFGAQQNARVGAGRIAGGEERGEGRDQEHQSNRYAEHKGVGRLGSKQDGAQAASAE